jgi:uncharacterized membrane protein
MNEPTELVGRGGVFSRARDWLFRGRVSNYLLLIIGLSLGYTIALSYLSLARYYTFYATFDDLGLENQILWILSHGWVGLYNQSQLGQIYALPIQQPITFALVPLYAIDPGPEFLLFLQSAALGFAAVPLYGFAHRRLGSERQAAVVAGVYLTFFSVASANLYDFHVEPLFPLFFFAACYFSARKWKAPMYLFVALIAAIDPLTLAVAVLFLVYISFPEEGSLLSWRAFKETVCRIVRPGDRAVAIVACLAFAGTLEALNVFHAAYLGVSHTSGMSPLGILTWNPGDKLRLFLYLLGGVAFLPLLRVRSLLLLVPYFAWVVYSANPPNLAVFGLAYPILGTAPVLVATVDGLAWLSAAPHPLAAEDARPKPSVRSLPSRGRRAWRRRFTHRQVGVGVLFLVGASFALVYFPLSPLNPYVPGGVGQGNHQVAQITTMTPAARFLYQVIDLIPADGSVLAQNNIPQVSSRVYVQSGNSPNPASPYDYILLDTNLNFITWATQLEPYVHAGVENRTFGTLAEGQGALLMERGYTEVPVLYEPALADYAANNLSRCPGSTVVGSAIQSSQSGPCMWYGPYANLLPGNYSVTFLLASSLAQVNHLRLITLDVSSNSGTVVYCNLNLTSENFSSPGRPVAFSLHVHLSNVVTGLEFRGYRPTGLATMTLYGVWMNQTSPYPYP